MLQKNVYILYPAGYGGSFINWAINASDRDLSINTVNNPVNKIANIKFGGTGTSHNHVRIPTHQSLESHMAWVYLNRPDYKHVYIINTTTVEIDKNIVQLLQADRDGVFINIHHNNDEIQKAFGTINSVIKWPSQYVASSGISGNNPIYPGFDFFNCADDKKFRNIVVRKYEFDWIFRHNSPINYDKLDKAISERQIWYDIRHKLQPHEVNNKTYIDNLNYQNRIFEISLQDLFSNKFIHWFDKFLKESEISTQFDTNKVHQVHPEYLSAQTTLKWFDAVTKYDMYKEVDNFLYSHSIIESCFLIKLFNGPNLDYIRSYDIDFWPDWYDNVKGPDWPDVLYEWNYRNFPDQIKNEMAQMGYIPKPVMDGINPIVSTGDWETADLLDIVKVF